MVAVETLSETQQILVIEDNHDTSEWLCSLLDGAGFATVASSRGSEALERIAMTEPDLVLLDLRLPDVDGLSVLRAVRATSFLPMIVLSGAAQERSKVDALEAGADDFLSKPFSSEELVARVRALLRRVSWTPKPQTHLTVRQLELDLARRQASVRGEPLHLTPIEYGLLATLMRHAGQVVTHEALLHAVWGQPTGDFSVLRVNISRLRQKLEENPRRPRYILTVAGQGYRMLSA